MGVEICDPYVFARNTAYPESSFPVKLNMGEEMIGAAQVKNTGNTVEFVVFGVYLRDPDGINRQMNAGSFYLDPGQQYGMYTGKEMFVIDKAGTWKIYANITQPTTKDKTWNAVSVEFGYAISDIKVTDYRR